MLHVPSMSRRAALATALAIGLAGSVASSDAGAGSRPRDRTIHADPFMRGAVAVWRDDGMHRPRHHRRWHHGRYRDACRIINGWRAFPTRDRHGYFDTRPVRC